MKQASVKVLWFAKPYAALHDPPLGLPCCEELAAEFCVSLTTTQQHARDHVGLPRVEC